MNYPCPEQKSPPDNTKIWRCLNLFHFEDLLCTKALFFARATKLPDPFDSKIPEFDICMEGQVRDYLIKFYVNEANYKIATGEPEVDREKNRTILRKNTVVNCWRIDEDESELMWKRYPGKTIAVISTVERLRESLDDSKFPICIAQVNYLDTLKQGIGKRWIFNDQFFTKKKSFSWENELRAVVLHNHTYPKQKEYSIDKKGMRVLADLEKLIVSICISPYVKKRFIENIQLLLSKHNLKKDVLESNFLTNN